MGVIGCWVISPFFLSNVSMAGVLCTMVSCNCDQLISFFYSENYFSFLCAVLQTVELGLGINLGENNLSLFWKQNFRRTSCL